jgi:phosphatidate cytidylyltransferase
MKSVWIIYLTILVYYLLGTIGIYFINRRKEAAVRKKAWIKHITYFAVTNIVFFSIPFNPLFFRIIAVIVIIAGVNELLKLYRESGYKHGSFFYAAILIFALFSAGFFFFSLMDKWLILFSFLILSIFDGFSQITGQLLGKKKLFPSVSPNKTVEGLIGGTIIAVLSALVFENLIGATSLKALFIALIISVFAFAGDALKSIYKRKYNVKDFSNLIPGHGGFLDRFDSLIATGTGVALLGLLMNF